MMAQAVCSLPSLDSFRSSLLFRAMSVSCNHDNDPTKTSRKTIETSNMTFYPAPSAPHHSELYSQPALVEARAVSFRQTNERTSTNSQNKPELIAIPSNNILLDYLPNGTVDSPTQYTYTRTQPSRIAATPIESPVRRFRGKIVKTKNAHLPDSVLAFKKARQSRTAGATWAGGAIGLFTLGPFGAIIGASTAYGISKSVGKAKERQLEKRAGTIPPSGQPVTAQLQQPTVVRQESSRLV